MNQANGFKYDVIGGQHNLLATRGMSEKKPTNSLFHSRWCAIYYGGMSSDAIKYLATQHNTIGDCRHEMTFKEKVRRKQIRSIDKKQERIFLPFVM